MRVFKYLMVCWCVVVWGSDYHIAFVHLGKNVPDCLFTTIKQARYMNPDCDLFLLMDQAGCEMLKSSQRGFLGDQRVSLINVSEIPQTEEHIKFKAINKIDFALTNGLWGFALERFFYLFDFIRDKNLENVFHFETDTMLYVNLDEILPMFKANEIEVGSTFESLVACVPCFVYIRDAIAIYPLMHHILHQTEMYTGEVPHIELGDMRMLASFFTQFGKEYMTSLPVLPKGYAERFPKRKSSYPLDNDTPLEFLEENLEKFSGYLFDAATLGIFAGGNDPRYFAKTGPGVIHHRSLFDPGKMKLFWDKDPQGRPVPFCKFQGNRYRIVNLHFHSKHPESYTSYEKRRKNFPTSSRNP